MKELKSAVVLVSAPDLKTAKHIAKAVLNKKLAAAAQITGKISSFFWWSGKINGKKENLILIIALKKNFQKIAGEIKKIHPYEVPQIISFDISQSTKEYTSWIKLYSN